MIIIWMLCHTYGNDLGTEMYIPRLGTSLLGIGDKFSRIIEGKIVGNDLIYIFSSYIF